jgi:hypothetical protein
MEGAKHTFLTNVIAVLPKDRMLAAAASNSMATPAARATVLSALSKTTVTAAEPDKVGNVKGTQVSTANTSILLDKQIETPAHLSPLKAEEATMPTVADAVSAASIPHQHQVGNA